MWYIMTNSHKSALSVSNFSSFWQKSSSEVCNEHQKCLKSMNLCSVIGKVCEMPRLVVSEASRETARLWLPVCHKLLPCRCMPLRNNRRATSIQDCTDSYSAWNRAWVKGHRVKLNINKIRELVMDCKKNMDTAAKKLQIQKPGFLTHMFKLAVHKF